MPKALRVVVLLGVHTKRGNRSKVNHEDSVRRSVALLRSKTQGDLNLSSAQLALRTLPKDTETLSSCRRLPRPCRSTWRPCRPLVDGKVATSGSTAAVQRKRYNIRFYSVALNRAT